MQHRFALAVYELEEIEAKYDVSFFSKSGSYGSSWLYIRDNQTGEEMPVSEVIPTLNYGETSQ
jgi:hypothetical protein